MGQREFMSTSISALFYSTFALIFVLELPDKTAFATIVMATRGRPLAIFFGSALAFTVQSFVAVMFGKLIGFFPERWVHLAAGLMFLAFAAYNWFSFEIEANPKPEANDAAEAHPSAGDVRSGPLFFTTAWKAFAVIFIAEWGDLTQIATASIAAKEQAHLPTVFWAATLALWTVTALAISVGTQVMRFVSIVLLKRFSTVALIAVGLYFLWTWY